MKVLFWSPVHGQAGTTSNITAISLTAGLGYHTKIVLTQTHFNYNNLEAPFVGSNSNNRASKYYFMDVGLDALIRSFKASKLDKEIIENCCISPSNTNILLLPGTTKSNRETFDYEMWTVMPNLLLNLEEACHNVFVDISSGENPLSNRLMQEADIIVINLNQNMSIADLFFKYFKEKLPEKKLFYLFGNYDCKSKYNMNNIRRKYFKDITLHNSAVIPYSTAYLDAQCDGKIIDFIRNNMQSKKDDPNYYFMHKAKRATEKIFRFAGMNLEAMERA